MQDFFRWEVLSLRMDDWGRKNAVGGSGGSGQMDGIMEGKFFALLIGQIGGIFFFLEKIGGKSEVAFSVLYR